MKGSLLNNPTRYFFRIVFGFLIVEFIAEVGFYMLGTVEVTLLRFLGLSLRMIFVAVLAQSLAVDSRLRRELKADKARSADRD